MRRVGGVLVLLLVTAACTSPSSRVADPPFPLGWQQRFLAPPADDRAVTQFAALLPPANGLGWLVVGSIFYGGDRSGLVIWESPDALTWTARWTGPRERVVAHSAARQGDRIVIVGEERLSGWDRRSAVWLATGADPPRRASLTPEVEGGLAGTMLKVSGDRGGGPGFLASGTVGSKPAVWTSPDGGKWQRLTALEELVNQTERSLVGAMLSTTQGPVVLGRDGSRMVVWTINAEGAWTAGEVGGDPTTDYPRDLITTPTGFLAVGYALEREVAIPRSWASSDGKSWLAATGAFDVPRKPINDSFGVSVDAVSRLGDMFIATGGGPSAKRVWTSVNGVTWADVPLPEPILESSYFDLRLVATLGNEALLGSSLRGAAHLLIRRNSQWTETGDSAGVFPTPAGLAGSGGIVAGPTGFLAWSNQRINGRRLEQENGTTLWWQSDDGVAWRSVPDPGPFSNTYVVDIAVSPSGFAAVGGTDFTPPGLRDPSGLWYRAWTSTDGSSWSRDDPPGVSPGGNHHLAGSVERNGRRIAVGWRFHGPDTDAAFWVREGNSAWRALTDVPGLTGPGYQAASGICTGDPGIVVVGGSGASWFSPDGLRWQLRTTSHAGANFRMRDCRYIAGRYIVVGSADVDNRTEVVVLTSTNGLDWTHVASPTFRATGNLIAFDMAVDGEDVLLIAQATENDLRVPAMLRSTDAGQTWSRLTLPAAKFRGLYEVSLSGAVIRNGVAYVAGIVDDQPVVWTSPLAEADSRL